MPLRIAFPGVRMELAEATGKKAAFLRGLVAELGLSDVVVHQGRAEDLGREASLRGAFDAALARGVAKMATLAELTLPFCRVGGKAVVHKTLDAADEIESARHAIETLGGEIRGVLGPDGALDDPNRSESRRTLLIIDKIAPTPDRYPRRAGIPSKRPLMDSRQGSRLGSRQAGNAGGAIA